MSDQESLTLDKSKPKVEEESKAVVDFSQDLENLEHMTTSGWIKEDISKKESPTPISTGNTKTINSKENYPKTNLKFKCNKNKKC